MATQRTLLTADQFFREYAGKEGRYELVRGEVVPMTPPGTVHGAVMMNIGAILRAHVKEHELGLVVGESGFLLEHAPDTVRGPDVSFVRKARIAAGGVPVAFYPEAPDLAVEVVSPSDTAAELEVKVREYLRNGTAQVWLAYPESRTVHVYNRDGTARWYGEDETLEGADVLPGFSVPVREFFAL
ncbi:MAG: Uma2 family endonuclease [Chloroflexi bacterium]|nr:Uma2 family endonuclease [Chloroflexota bacterium]